MLLLKETEDKFVSSLKTKDRKLAERRLKEFRGDADKLVSGGRNRISFTQLGEIWKPVACSQP